MLQRVNINLYTLFLIVCLIAGFARAQEVPFDLVSNESRSQNEQFTFTYFPDFASDFQDPPENLQTVSQRIAEMPLPIDFEEARANLQDVGVVQTDPFFFDPTAEAVVRDTGFVAVTDIDEPDATWLMIEFVEWPFPPDAKLKVIDLNRKDSQTYTSDLLREWGWTSSIIIGSRVRIILELPATRQFSRTPENIDLNDSIRNIYSGRGFKPIYNTDERGSDEVEHSGTPEREHGICRADERTPVKDATLARDFRSKCTVFRVEKHIYATAGHCLLNNRKLFKAMFNVPPSDTWGNPVSPAKEHHFPLIRSSVRCQDCKLGIDLPHGQDWAVFLLGRNTAEPPVTPEAKYRFVDLAVEYNQNWIENNVAQVEVIGFGTDSFPPEADRALQHSTDDFLQIDMVSNNHIVVKHLVDTTKGNSGSPIISADGGDGRRFIGIHNGGECDPSSNEPNKGTAFSNQGLREAISALRNEIRAGKYDNIIK